jgi:hypothetical protein
MENKELNKKLDNFLGNEDDLDQEVKQKRKVLKDKSLTERINRKILLEDGRQLLRG